MWVKETRSSRISQWLRLNYSIAVCKTISAANSFIDDLHMLGGLHKTSPMILLCISLSRPALEMRVGLSRNIKGTIYELHNVHLLSLCSKRAQEIKCQNQISPPTRSIRGILQFRSQRDDLSAESLSQADCISPVPSESRNHSSRFNDSWYTSPWTIRNSPELHCGSSTFKAYIPRPPN